jgi:hypothetical protein
MLSKRCHGRIVRAIAKDDKWLLYKNTFFACEGFDSAGQYGHLNLAPLLMRSNESLQMTCPHGISIGGFESVACSLLTGQTKMEWKW